MYIAGVHQGLRLSSYFVVIKLFKLVLLIIIAIMTMNPNISLCEPSNVKLKKNNFTRQAIKYDSRNLMQGQYLQRPVWNSHHSSLHLLTSDRSYKFHELWFVCTGQCADVFSRISVLWPEHLLTKPPLSLSRKKQHLVATPLQIEVARQEVFWT